MSSQTFVVVGGGLAGFSAAIELASTGHKVRIHEQSKQLGGRAATHRQQGFAMNLGPHGFLRGGVMRQQFDAWGIAYSGKAPLRESAAYLIANGDRHVFPTRAMGLFVSSYFSPRDQIRLEQTLQEIQRMRATEVRGKSMRAWIEDQGASEHGARLLAALTRLSTYAADLDLLDAGAAIAQLQLAFSQSVLYLDGGWETLITGLRRKAESLGVRIHTESGVKRVETGMVEMRSGKRFAPDGIILAIPPKEVEAVTGREVTAGTPARAACLDLALRRLPARAGTFALGLDQPTYFSVHSLYAGELAPKGEALVHVAKYLDRGSSGIREELEQAADIAAPGWREEAIFTRFLPEMTVVHSIPQAGRARVDVDALGMPRVMIAGDWVGPEAMLADAAVSSGLRAARALAQRVAGKAA